MFVRFDVFVFYSVGDHSFDRGCPADQTRRLESTDHIEHNVGTLGLLGNIPVPTLESELIVEATEPEWTGTVLVTEEKPATDFLFGQNASFDPQLLRRWIAENLDDEASRSAFTNFI